MDVGLGDRLGICMRKSGDAVASIFGIIKARAAYVPVDSTAPASRNAFIFHNCAVKVFIVDARLAEALDLGSAKSVSLPTRKASGSLARRDGDEVVYVSARLKDVVSSAAQLHGWNQPSGMSVSIANIPMPTAEERAEMRALDAKLDAIAAKLKA